MITLLVGENSFEMSRAVDELMSQFSGAAEKFDGDDLELSQLPDLLMGATLFATERLIIIRELSANKQLWEVLPDWSGRIADEVHVVLVEPKPDKRTKTFKDLKKVANVKEFSLWGERDVSTAEAWVIKEAQKQGLTLDRKNAQLLVQRVGVDQWQLFHAIEKLSVLDNVTPEVIEKVIEANPSESVFNLFDAALRGESKKVQSMVATLQLTQDPYMTFGLLSGQAFQLAVLAAASEPPSEIAAAIGAHPYALSKLAPHAKSLGRVKVKKIVQAFADTDVAMKSTATEPWLLIEQALIKTATV